MNGYPALIWVQSCERNPKTGKPEITWFKAVQGNDSFYVVQKAFRFMPAQEQMTEALAYLGTVKVVRLAAGGSGVPEGEELVWDANRRAWLHRRRDHAHSTRRTIARGLAMLRGQAGGNAEA